MSVNFKSYYNKISNSGHDEYNKYHGGKAGDQTGGEWAIINWYSRPWTCVLRHPDKAVRQLLAELHIEAAKNNNIGYDQYQRNTYWTQLVKAKYRPANIKTKCEADCSMGVISNVKAVGHLKNLSSLKNLSATYTGNLKSGLKAAGFQVLTDKKYLTSSAYLVPGDILLYEGHHTAVNLGIGTKSGYTQIMDEQAKKAAEAKKKAQAQAAAKKKAAQEAAKKPAAAKKETTTKNTSSTLTVNKTGKYSKTVKKTGKVTANRLNVRKGPGLKYNNISSYPTIIKDKKVSICDLALDASGNKWYYIKISGSKGDKFGFVKATYIKIV